MTRKNPDTGKPEIIDPSPQDISKAFRDLPADVKPINPFDVTPEILDRSTYSTVLTGKGLIDGAESLAEAAEMLRNASQELEEMAHEGAKLAAPVKDDHGIVVTSNPSVAERYGMGEYPGR